MGKIIAMGLLFFVLSAFLYKITYSGHVTETNSKDFSRKYKDLHAYTESVLYISSRTNWLNETEFAEFEFFESDYLDYRSMIPLEASSVMMRGIRMTLKPDLN